MNFVKFIISYTINNIKYKFNIIIINITKFVFSFFKLCWEILKCVILGLICIFRFFSLPIFFSLKEIDEIEL